MLAACGSNKDDLARPAPQPPSIDSELDIAEINSEPLSVGEFIERANLICLEATESIQGLAPPESLSDLARNIPKLQEIAQSEFDQLRKLGSPELPADRLDTSYFLLLEQQLVLLADLGEAARIDDLAEARNVLAQATAINAQASAIAVEYGIEECDGTAATNRDGDILDASLPTPLTPAEEFIASADDICRESNVLVGTMREPQTIDESITALNYILDITIEEFDLLKLLKPPEEFSGDFEDLLILREEQIGVLDRLKKALEVSDRDAVGEALLESSILNSSAGEIQQGIGFEVCGVEPVQFVPGRKPAPDEP